MKKAVDEVSQGPTGIPSKEITSALGKGKANVRNLCKKPFTNQIKGAKY